MATGKKILVAYYSRTGTTERVAKDIASRLGADIERIEDKKSRKGILGWLFGGRDATRGFSTEIGELQKDPAGYDLTIIGTPVWAWNMTPAARAYLEKTKDRLTNVAFFMTSGSTRPEKGVAFMEGIIGKKAVASVGFFTRDMHSEKDYREKREKFLDAVEQGTGK